MENVLYLCDRNLNISHVLLKELGKNQRNVAVTPAYVKVTAVIMRAKNYSPTDVSLRLGVYFYFS